MTQEKKHSEFKPNEAQKKIFENKKEERVSIKKIHGLIVLPFFPLVVIFSFLIWLYLEHICLAWEKWKETFWN